MTQPVAHVHAIGTAVPGNDVHRAHLEWATSQLADRRDRSLFSRMAERSGIDHRWSVLPCDQFGSSPVDPGGFYDGGSFPSTGQRMQVYAREAPDLAMAAIADLERQVPLSGITHIVVASCTGFVAPGIDQIIAARLGLDPGVERTLIGFMGCYAAVSALRAAHYIARCDAGARVLVVTVELCSLHLVASHDMKVLLGAMQFGDGAAAALVSAKPSGVRLESFLPTTLPDSADLIQWTIGDTGFEMVLSGEVPHRIAQGLGDTTLRDRLIRGCDPAALAWAVHPGGKSILDAVEHALDLAPDRLAPSRSVLARFGNMSSTTLLFVLAELMADPGWEKGVAMAFGPGMAAETFAFGRP
ncbi:type III polyketide synthase [Croceicoccus bisphenolivorans]|uniref:type III polyketide synthase n=1 Tax=Croceicoccus bisphenolivorans TaxID=1783232 RepID=UPI00082E8E0B|nr:type III polyketide synthase [Croceicoccus bisphenolivorans]